MLDSVREAVVIGGGVLGLEAAWELKKSGCKVTVLEAAPQLMGRQLDEEAGNMLKAISQGQGIRILTSASIEQIEGEEHVTGVRLSAGGGHPRPVSDRLRRCPPQHPDCTGGWTVCGPWRAGKQQYAHQHFRCLRLRRLCPV